METVSTYSEARNEYLKQLYTWITPSMIQFYRGLWADALRTGGNQRVMVVFQERCAEVPKWNQDIIDQHVGKLLDTCRCDYLEELMSAVFIAHTKVLISVRISTRQKKLQITLPKLDNFLHRIFSECARSFWKAPYLFLEDAKPIEMQKNLLQAEALCNDAIGAAVRSLLPIKNILNEYLSEDLDGEELETVKGGSKSPVATAKPESVIAHEPVAASEPEHVSAPESEHVSAPEPEHVSAPEPVVAHEHVAAPEHVVAPEPVAASPVSERVSEPAAAATAATAVASSTVAAEPEEIVIDAEPAVHFSNYDNEFTDDDGGTFKYVPKDTDDTPHLEIKEGSEIPLSADTSITSLDAPGPAEATAAAAPVSEKVEIDEILD